MRVRQKTYDSLRVSRSPGQPAVSLERDDRSGRVLGGVLQQLLCQVQKLGSAVGEAQRQSVSAAVLRGSVLLLLMVVVVAVRDHSAHQRGHGIFNFAYHRSKICDISGARRTVILTTRPYTSPAAKTKRTNA